MAAEREQAMEELRARFGAIEGRFAAVEEQQRAQNERHNQLVLKLDEYAGSMAAAVKAEVEKLATGLRELYQKTELAVIGLANRVHTLEQSGARKDRAKTLLHQKDMKPRELNKDEEWRRWKADVEDYVEEAVPGMKDQLERAREADIAIEESWFGQDPDGWWAMGENLWRFLRKYTGTEARRIISGVSDDNGWEAWRQLNQQYEPGTAAREAQVMARVMNMTQKKAKNSKETKAMMIEMGERARRVEEVTGKPVDDRTMKSVITCFLDSETAKHTSQCQGSATSLPTLKKKIMEFTNIMTANMDEKMDVGMIRGRGCRWGDEEEDAEADDEDHVDGGINWVGERCHQCGGVRHYARECP